MKKTINLAKVASFVMLLTVSAMILVAGTYAKYSSTASGTDATVVANWSFEVNGTDIAVKGTPTTFDFNLFDTTTIKDSDGSTEEDVVEGLIAPGTSGSFEFELKNTSDVSAKYSISLGVNKTTIPLEFSFDGGTTWTDVTNLSDLVSTDVMKFGTSKYVTVQWKWAFGENETTDATLGGQEVIVTANITATQVDNGDINTEQDAIISNFDFGWSQGIINSSGEIQTEGSTTLNNYYSDLLYFEKLQLNLLADNVMFKIVEYDEDGNFISAGSWQSKEQTQWTSGGTDSIIIEDKYVRIAIADTTINNSQEYTITPEQYSSRYSYVINGNNTESRFDFGWVQGTIKSDTGEINTNGSQQLNNYYTPIIYFEKLQLNLLTDNVMFKIVEYDEDGNFISAGSWQSKEQTQWTSGGTDSITIEDKYVRIAIADTTINDSSVYTITPSEYSERYSYSIEGETYRIGVEYKLLAVETIALPDIKYGETGKGFTITGLAYSASDNTYYAGNYGKVYTSDTTVNNTIVHLSSDLKTNLGEIELPNISEVQGVTVDSSDNTLWYVSPPDNKMYHISTTGEELGEVNLGTNATGIAYDSRTDTLWVLDSTKLINVEKDGTVNTTITLDISNVDQIYLDETDNSIYITAGNNYQGDSYVYIVNLSTQKSKLLYTLEDSHAIEGIHIKDGKMYIGNDGVYHEAKIESNIIQVYTIE